MRIDQTSAPQCLEKRTGDMDMASFAEPAGLEDFDLRETLNDIVVRTATFQAFREALVSFRGHLH
jgi:hypothetical protein